MNFLEMETLGRNQKEMLEIKITVAEMKNDLLGSLANSRLDVAVERVSEPEDKLKCKKKREQENKKETEHPGNLRQFEKV